MAQFGDLKKVFHSGRVQPPARRRKISQRPSGKTQPKTTLVTTVTKLNKDANFAQLFELAAHQAPDRIAVVDGERQWTYAQMLADVLSTAVWLRDEKAVALNDNVCVRMRNSYELLVACLAINYVGACWMPLGFEIPKIDHMLADAGVKVVMEALPPQRADVGDVRTYNHQHVTRDNHLFLVYSSGSTGKPKGILQSQRAFLEAFDWRFTHVPNGPQTRMAACIFFIWEAFRPLLCGGTVFVLPKMTLLDGQALSAFLLDHQINEIQFTPSSAQVFVRHLERNPTEFPLLECVWLCGEVVRGDLARRMDKVFSGSQRLLNLYSISEAPDLAIGDLRAHLDCELQPLTWFIDGFECRLEEKNELVVSAPTVSPLGYLGRDDLNATRFDHATDPATYWTGDHGSFEGGKLVVAGRCDFMKKVRGYSVQIDELEHELGRLTGAVNAVVHFDEVTSELHAFVQSPTVENEAEIFALMRAELPSYAVPTHLTVVHHEMGTVDAVSGKRARKDLGHSFGPLGDLWQKILKRAPGAGDDFFLCGGDSLMAVSLLEEINARFGVELRITDFYEQSSIEDLYAAVHGLEASKEDEMERDVTALVEAHKDRRFVPQGGFKAVKDAQRILVTGASGYLGTWLVRALTEGLGKEVHCLVRDPEAWRQRVAQTYRTELPWQRVHCIVGDLQQERFGLDAEAFEAHVGAFDAIVHCASLVNFSVSYARLQQTNLRGLETLLHWATGASFHMISSNAIYPAGHGHCEPSALDGLKSPQNTPYGRSKWVLEKALRRLEVPAAFYRLGNIGPHTSGAYNRNDAQMRLLEVCQTMGAGIDDDQLGIEFTPLEQVTDLILNHDRPEAINLVNNDRQPLAQVRYPRMLSLEAWMAQAQSVDPVLVQMLGVVGRWLQDDNHYDSPSVEADYAPRIEALRAFMRAHHQSN